jgi:hypothetical protein
MGIFFDLGIDFFCGIMVFYRLGNYILTIKEIIMAVAEKSLKKLKGWETESVFGEPVSHERYTVASDADADAAFSYAINKHRKALEELARHDNS